jgi:hypothetical protein
MIPAQLLIFAVLLVPRFGSPGEPAGATDDEVEKEFGFRRDIRSIESALGGTDINRKVRSAIYLWSNYPDHRPRIEGMLVSDPSTEFRRRVAQYLVAKYKHKPAMAVVREAALAADISTHQGAAAFLSGASVIAGASEEVLDPQRALKILEMPEHGFSDLIGNEFEYSRWDSVRVMAASYLVDHPNIIEKKDLRKALERYLADVEKAIGSTNGRKRAYWEKRLPTALAIAQRAGYGDLVKSYKGKEALLNDGYERMRLKRIVERAQKDP